MDTEFWEQKACAHCMLWPLYHSKADEWDGMVYDLETAARNADNWQRQNVVGRDVYLRLEGSMAPKRDREAQERDEQHGQRLYSVAWWDDNGSRGHSAPLTEAEANRVRDAHRHEQSTRHAVKVQVDG